MKLRIFAFIFVLALLGAIPALTAGQTMHTPPPGGALHQALSWKGLYIGGNGSGLWAAPGQFHFVEPDGSGDAPSTAQGAFIGGTAGYNFQFAHKYVAGIEGDGDWTNISGVTYCPNDIYYCTSRVDALASVRGRFGIAYKRWLFFGTGGLGIGDFKYRTYYVSTGVDYAKPYTATKEGWVAGGGAEFAASHRIALKVEYGYYGFQSTTAPVGTLDGSYGYTIVNTIPQLIKLGLNYHF